ncbi:uncharacterized protein [Apostichopus japonicus]|uniref:uncharacterized protein isoform X1 n=1 Tax=Stichopus japonicus TaxID=307972 RepID=UPI003AB8F55A
MRLWTTQTLLQWSLIIATLLSQPMRRSGIVQANGRTSSCETTGTDMGVIGDSCVDHCFRYERGRNCQCNYQCIKCRNCCGDYEDCNKLASCATRCGADYNSSDDCHCDNHCEEHQNCCFDYSEHCKPPTSTTAVTNLTTEANGEPPTSSTEVPTLTTEANEEPPTSSTEVPTLTTEANGESSTSATAVTTLTSKYGESPTSATAVTTLTSKPYGDSGLIVVVILVICLVITSAIAAAVFILVRKRRTNPTTTENGSNAHGSGPTNVISGKGPEEQGSVYYSSVKESEYANQEEGVDSTIVYHIYEKQIFQDIVTT